MISAPIDTSLQTAWQARLPDPSALHHLFPSGVLHRGRKYLRHGRVSRLEYGENEIRAEVNGAGLYTTRLCWSGGRLQYLCTCPYGVGCKHAAAVLLKARLETEAAPVVEAPRARSSAVPTPSPRPATLPATGPRASTVQAPRTAPAAPAPASPPSTPPLPDLFRLLQPPQPAVTRRRLWVAVHADFAQRDFRLYFLVDSPRLRRSLRSLDEVITMVRHGSWGWQEAQPEWDEADLTLLQMVCLLPDALGYGVRAKVLGAESFCAFLLMAAFYPRLLLAPAAAHPGAFDAATLEPLRVSLQPLRLLFDGSWSGGAATVCARLCRPDGSEAPARELRRVAGGQGAAAWWFDGHGFFRDDGSFHPDLVTQAAREQKYCLEGPEALRLFEPQLARFSAALAATWPVVETIAAVTPVLYLDYETSPERLLARALLRSSEFGVEWTAGPGEAAWLPHPQDSSRWLCCDPAARGRQHDLLTQAGFQDTGQGGYVLKEFDQIAEFLFTRLPAWMQQGQVFTSDAVRRLLDGGRPVQPRISITSSGLDWFHLDVRFFDGEEELDTAAIWKAIRAGRRYVRLRGPHAGRVVSLDQESLPRLRRELEELGEGADHRYRCSPFLLFSAVEGLEKVGRVDLAPEVSAFYQRLRAFRGIRPADPPAELAPVLRSYQQQGLAYLHYLEEMNFGGILADDMGLGKTLQVLAYLENLRLSRGTAPNLVVCPTTVAHNWVAEARRFTPQMKTLLLERGTARQAHFSHLERYDLVVTSYALLRRDLERLKTFCFRTLVLDEAQNIKNPATLAAACARQLRAERRLALTGTPLENSVLDLWSIYDCLLPGLLGTLPQFQARYQAPIEKENIPEVRERLARRIRPFLLRRLKTDVTPELPPRVEQTFECELTPVQRRLYREVAEQARGEVMQTVREQGLAKSQIHILAALLRLRQICCHPLLLAGRLDGRLPARNQDQLSGKMNAFFELLETVLSGGHRVLVFSQFVQMLGILRRQLDLRGIPYAYLDGQTVRRQEQIERFQSGPGQQVFLLSLKAGGTGVNLTAADYVILYDPWWNPAVENQAIDRTHRIGQTQSVMAYRMVTLGTVEEKILKLQARKAELVRAVVESDTAFAKQLTLDDLEELFSAA